MGKSILLGLAVVVMAACGGDASMDGPSGGSGGGGGAAGSGGGGAGGAGGTGGTGGTSSGGGSGGGSLSWQDCFDDDGQTVQWALNLCEGDTCLMVEHQIDCCGNIMFVGVTEDALADFEACEAAWRATLPLCDCPMGQPQVQQPYGQTVDGEDGATVSCTNWTMDSGICLTQPL